MLDIFDILGPVMVGPSSSHTAGAVRIGNMARKLLGGEPKIAKIYLHGSFAETGAGHGTDRALVAGLLGMKPDDLEIPNSFEIAKQRGLEFSFERVQLRSAHPKTASLKLTDADGNTMEIQASSIGGGRIRVDRLDGVDVSFSGDYNTLIIHNLDIYGTVAEVARVLAEEKINIANMNLYRSQRWGAVLMVMEVDQKVSSEVRQRIMGLKSVERLTYYEKEDE